MLHLIEAIASFDRQSYDDFELIISDDNSPDSIDQLLLFLDGTRLQYIYWRNQINLGYDANIRNAIDMSTGDFVLLMGNDDKLSNIDVLSLISGTIDAYPNAGSIITNYRELGSGQIYRRAKRTGRVGAGPSIAAGTFRNYSFVSGIVLNGRGARAATSAIVDGSEMYQMYLGTSLVAQGRDLVEIDAVCVDKDIQIQGEVVDSYRTKATPSLQKARHLPMRDLLRVVWAGIAAWVDTTTGQKLCGSAARQLYSYTFPFWAVEYRRTRSWRFAAHVIFGVRPSAVASATPLTGPQRLRLWMRYAITCGGALITPIRLFDVLRPALYRLAKR